MSVANAPDRGSRPAERSRHRFYAHTLDGKPPSQWQLLESHLSSVGELAARFAAAFGAAEWATAAGLWHDLGKYSEAFQKYLRQATGDPHVADATAKVDHSTAGAQHAVASIPVLGHLLAFVIAGHHAGLHDAVSDRACMERRLSKTIEPWHSAPDSLVVPPLLRPPRILQNGLAARDGFCVAFFTRMLFSCLVDADFLDTEEFMASERAHRRPSWPPDILQRMASAVDAWIDDLDVEDTPVNRARNHVREACIATSSMEPGHFSLTVPTGGGKTLSSLAFALRHAAHHGLERVIYVAPFTTIIEQNADVFRKVLASELGREIPDPVIEHHSNLDVGEEAGTETTASRLAAENWAAPLIVTTSVQFYESLFANRTSRCRKLHNLARSVVILDEAQTLPVDYLYPCLRALDELVQSYGSTVVLCTATQPAIHQRGGFDIGLAGVREIAPDPPRLYHSLRRVEVEDLGALRDEELAERLLSHDRVLCIVNTRSHARRLYGHLGDAASRHFHLSALMCPAHRTARIDQIRKRLRTGQTCRVVSTQLIEAGVDIDFPVVYRSYAGLDSIAQAAGRCNRNGLLAGMGTTFLFRAEDRRAERYFSDTTNAASQVIPLHEDPLSLEAVEHYFRLYYWDQSSRWDRKQILDAFQLNNDLTLPFLFAFSKVARDFRLIEDAGEPVIVPWGDIGRSLCDDLRSTWKLPRRSLLQRLQRYTVQVRYRAWREHVGRVVELVHDRYPVLAEMSYYDDAVGLVLDGDLEPLIA